MPHLIRRSAGGFEVQSFDEPEGVSLEDYLRETYREYPVQALVRDVHRMQREYNAAWKKTGTMYMARTGATRLHTKEWYESSEWRACQAQYPFKPALPSTGILKFQGSIAEYYARIGRRWSTNQKSHRALLSALAAIKEDKVLAALGY